MVQPRYRYSRRLCALLACGALIALAGCGGAKSGRLVDYLDELEFDVPLETAAYVSLGRFDVPIATSKASTRASKFVQQIDEGGLVWMRLQFELTAETTPQQEKAVAAAVEKHRGLLNDAVLTIVRTSTVDELADSRLAAVQARISELARPLLGESRVRQLVLNDPQSVADREKREQAKAASAHGGHAGGHGEAHVRHGEEQGEAHGGGQDYETHGDGQSDAEHPGEGHGDDHGHH
jgi:hypothetical protein